MDFFRTVPPTPAANAAANPTVPGTVNSTQAGGPGAFPEVKQDGNTPLEEYGKLWEVDPTATKPSPLVPDLSVTPEGLQRHAATMDFAKGIDPKLVADALKGDVNSFLAVLNKVGQAGYAQAAGASAKITEMALSKQSETFMNEHLPRALRDANIQQAIQSDNPIFSNPAVSPLLGNLETQLASKFPTESATQISNRAKVFLSGMAKSIVESEGGQVTAKGASTSGIPGKQKAATDWSTFLEG